MFPASFDYERATTTREAVDLMQEHADRNPALLAGGHSLIPMMKQRLAQPEILIDIRGIEELSGVDDGSDTLTIGALTRHVELETSPVIAERAPCLAEAAAEIGDPQIRNRGTIGGNLAHADPSADLPAPVLALESTIRAQGPDGIRRVDPETFFQGMFMTDLAEDEILTHVEVPQPKRPTISTYTKKTSPASGYALAGVAIVLEVKEGIVREARLAVNGVAHRPSRLTAAEQQLNEQPLTPESIDAASQRAGESLPTDQLLSDSQAGPEYRLQLLRTYTHKALEKLADRWDDET